MRLFFRIFSSAVLLAAAPVVAEPPRFDKSTAIELDNAEGLLDSPNLVRVAVTDRAVAPAELYGIAFPAVRERAKRGEVHGVLIEFDPAKRNELKVTRLEKPDDPHESLAMITVSSDEAWKALSIFPDRVNGHLVLADDGVDVTFAAPIARDPVVETLHGPAARNSPFVATLRQYYAALASADIAALDRIESRESHLHRPSLPLPPQFKAAVAKIGKTLDAADTVVVRGSTAAVILPEQSWSSFVREDGAWKLAN